jgi:hypothetical protein
MIRELTIGERNAIADALTRRASKLDARTERLLSRKRRVDPDSEINETDAEDKLDKASLKRAIALTQQANASYTLGQFIRRNKVTVDCLLTIPEQF